MKMDIRTVVTHKAALSPCRYLYAERTGNSIVVDSGSGGKLFLSKDEVKALYEFTSKTGGVE